MINNKLNGVFALIAFVFFTQNAFSQNLLINGDFESGGNGVGFSLNGAGYTQINAPFSGTTSPGNYAFTTNPQPMNTSVFISGGDHTTGTGNMMVIDGNSTGGAQRFWRAGNTGGGVCSLTIGATYTFSYWIKSVSTTVTNAATQADIGIQFNNANNITLVAGSTLAPLPASGWQQVIYTFTPTNACVNIELWNNNTNMVGNDFAVDDFVLTPPPTALSITSSFTNPRCRNSNDGVIVGYGIGGITPYFSFNLTGPVNQSNITGVFTGLPPGNYTIQVIDAMGSDAQMFVTLTNPSGINAGTDATICSGNSTTLSATGSATGYTWTANPADASLTTLNISNPIVSPTQTTTYTATSTTNNTINLISNGNFSNGNVGFDTDYTFFSSSNPSGSQRAYGVTLNPNTWETGFAACGDHTSGSGLMMVVDGSIYNTGNDLVWAQTVGVGASQNYTLSFWVQTLSVNNPATLRVVINGVTVGTINAPATTCTWLNFSQVWNSGANTTAAIQIFDTNVNSNGNDFALDDIAFTTTSTCTLTDQVVVTVNSALTPVISCGTATSSSVTFNWAAVTGATNYTVSYSINGGTPVNAGTTNSTNYTVSSLLSTDNVTITVTPNGTGCFASTVDTCGALSSCPSPVASVTQQPTCAVPTGTIVFTSPLNTSPLPIPSDLFISEVTDESTGSLSYIEIFNGTGSAKNLSNYKLKVYNNGGSTPSTNCDISLSGTLANNDVFVVGLGSATNQGGVIPDLVVAACGAFNTDDNVRLTTSSDVEIDLWGRTDGVSFTPLNQAGYTYRRNQTAPHPSLVWNPADWTALDPQDYTNVGTYSLQLANYQYSVNNGANYQSSPTFTGLAPNTYNLVIKDLVSGCVSSPPLVLVVNPTPTVTPPSVSNVTYCQNSTASPLTATPSTGGTLNWYGTNVTGGTASATAPTPSTSSLGTTTYYVSQTVGGCESTRAAIVVTITNQAPTATPNLFCDDANATPTSASFDFNNVGQTSFTYTYSIDGGTPVTGSLVSPSHFDVSGVTQGQAVTFTLTWNGVCTASQTVTCYPQCVTPVTPTFSPVATICEGQTLSPLPTTSLNGVNGSWSPALNNLATTNYLFTPSNAGECATNTNLTITVIPDPTLVINNPTAVCSPNVVNLTAAAVTNGTNVGTLTYWTNATATTPLSNPNAVSVSGTYYIKNTNGICTDIKPVVVTINPSPSLSITNPSAVCSPNTVDITQSSITSGSSGGGTLTYWTNASATTPLVNPNSISASGTYYIKSTVGSCFDIKPVVVTINPSPSLSITNPSAVCSPNTVDITQSSITSGSSGGGILTYWTNATATTPLVNPNSISASGTYYIKSTVGSCFDIKPVVVTINPTPSLIIVNPSPVCSPSTVNITLPAITSGSTAGGTLTYWTNASATTSLINPSTISVSGTYYIKLTVGSCFDIKPVTVVINPTINPTFNIPNVYCEGASIPALPLVSNNGISGTWSPALNNLSTANYLFTPNTGQCANSFNQFINIIPNVTPTLNIVETCNSNSVTVTNPLGSDYEYSLDGLPYQASPFFNNLPVGNHTIVSHHIVANCISNPENFVINSVSNDVVVNQNPSPLEICDPNNDGFEIFDLTTAINDITNNIPYNVTFHETLTDATVDGTVIPNASAYFNINPWLQTIYVRVESLTTSCFEIVSLTLQVHPTPEAVEPADLHLCDYNGAIGYESFDLTQLIPEVLGSMDATQHTVTFYTSETEAQQGTNWISNTAGYTNGVIDQQTIWIRVENNATGCYDVVSVDLIVDPLPNSLQPSYPAYSLCDNDQSSIGYESFDLESKVDDILLGQTGMSVTFYPSLLDAQNNTNAIPNTNLNYINSIQYVQTLGIRITNDSTGCYIISTMDIRVEPLPEPVPPTDPYVVCDDNQDGFAPFDLSTLTSDILQGENYLISYHETQTDAEQGNNALPMNYININPFVQYLYVRAEDPDTGCVKVIMIELNVNPSPVAPINLDDITLCDDQDNNTQNGIRLVDLTQRTPDVLAQQPLSPSSYEVTYYTSQLLADQGTLPITPATAYMGSNGDTIWVRVENLATGCYQLGTFQLVIGIPLQVLTPQPINECDNDSNPNDQHTTFDLTVRTIAPSGYTIKYYPSLAEAHSGTNEILDPTSYINVPPAVQTLGIAIISAEGCKSYTTLNIRVLPVPTPNTTPSTLPALCEEVTGSGQAHVDLTQNATYIINNDPNVVLHYFNSMSDLEANTGEITNPANALVGDVSIAGQTINYIQYVYIAVSSTVNSDYTGRPCYVVVPQGYIINPLPVVAQLPNGNIYQECEADPSGINDGITQFNLNGQITNLLVGNQTTPASSYSVAFYEGPGATNMIGNPSNYTNLSNPQTIYVVITNTTTGCDSAVGQFDLVVNPKPVFAIDITTDLNYETCDENDGINDGQTLHNGLPLSDYIDDILGTTQSPTDYTVTFHYNSQADAEAGVNAIQDLATYQVQTGTYWVRIENNLTGCYITDSFNVLIEKLAEPLIESNTGSNIACVNWNTTAVLNNLILDSQVTGNYTFEWYADGVLIPGETASTLAITDMALANITYSVIAVSNSALGCRSAEVSFEVIRSGEAANMSYTVTNAFSDNQIITVTNDGYGIYHYSLDDGPILDNGGIFTNVPFGEHTVYVWDVRDPDGYSCGVAQITGVQVIDYPHYFTPNGDGIHDTWNIVGLGKQPSAKIYIFDRYGKLLKQISSTGDGWDGTFNGALMPSTDYWFLVEYEEQGQIKEFKAHFSLKR